MNKVRIINRVFLVTVLLSIVGSYINLWVLDYTDNYFAVLMISQVILVLPSAIYLISSKTSIGKAIRFKKIKVSNIILINVFYQCYINAICNKQYGWFYGKYPWK